MYITALIVMCPCVCFIRLLEIEELLDGPARPGVGGFDVGDICCAHSNADNRYAMPGQLEYQTCA